MLGELDINPAFIASRERLYHLWEKGNWSAKSLDLINDVHDWGEKLSEEQRQAIHYITAMFLQGEMVVTEKLFPLFLAAQRYEDRIYLATQIADEARHHVFVDRFLREVVGVGSDMRSTLGAIQSELPKGYQKLLVELDHLMDQLHRRPQNKPLLARALVIYHGILEGIAQIAQRFLMTFGKYTGLLPGLIQGIKHMAHDETRHVAFGLSWLRELIAADPRCRASALHEVKRALPWVIDIFLPPERDLTYIDSLGVPLRETCILLVTLLETRINYIGIPLSEIPDLVKLGYDDLPSTQVDRLLTLKASGILGKNGDVQVTEEVIDAIFVAIRNRVTHKHIKQKSPIIIQWIFDESVQLRYLKIDEEGRCHTGIGQSPDAELILTVQAVDWIHIALGHINPLVALIARRLRLKGNWRLALLLA